MPSAASPCALPTSASKPTAMAANMHTQALIVLHIEGAGQLAPLPVPCSQVCSSLVLVFGSKHSWLRFCVLSIRCISNLG
jgi:hypothetical protein